MNYEQVIFKEYFLEHFEKLEEQLKTLFFKKIERIEKKDNITKRLHFSNSKYQLRCLRIGQFRFIFVSEGLRAIFLDVMYRELNYTDNYMQKLLKVYKYGK